MVADGVPIFARLVLSELVTNGGQGVRVKVGKVVAVVARIEEVLVEGFDGG